MKKSLLKEVFAKAGYDRPRKRIIAESSSPGKNEKLTKQEKKEEKRERKKKK